MPSITELWAGKIYGTNTGKVFLEIAGGDAAIFGTLKLADDSFGLSTLDVAGKFEGGILTLTGHPTAPVEGVEQGQIEAIGRLQQNGQIWGEWKSSIGTGGTFELYPHVGTREKSSLGPEQVYTASRELGALRLFREDVLGLISSLQAKFPESRVVVTHIDRGAELARFSNDFVGDLDRLEKLTWLKLNVQAVAAAGLSKIVTIDLGQNFNRITTQGPDESWVLGEAEAISSVLKRRESSLSTRLGKYRISFNQLIGVAAFIAMPDLTLWLRCVFMIGVILILSLAAKLQAALIPNLLVDLKNNRSEKISQAWPSILSWLISATAGVAASGIYAALTHFFK